MEKIREFKCSRCGACCKNIGYVEEASHLDRGDGVCKYYSDDKKMCTIYDFRPEICRVDKMYKRFKSEMSWDKYLDLSYEACDKLRALEKEKKLENTEVLLFDDEIEENNFD